MVLKLNAVYFIPHVMKMLYKKSPKIHQGELFKIDLFHTLFLIRIYTGL